MDFCALHSSIAVLVLAAGCALTPPLPAEELDRSYASFTHAIEEGAEDFAPGDLARAREKLRLAERFIAAKDYKRARWLLEQAYVDAELAGVNAKVARVRARR